MSIFLPATLNQKCTYLMLVVGEVTFSTMAEVFYG